MIHAIVHLDGVDKTGKDSIKTEIVKQSNGRVLVVARSFLSQIAYNRIYNRFIDESFFIQKMKLGIKFSVVVGLIVIINKIY